MRSRNSATTCGSSVRHSGDQAGTPEDQGRKNSSSRSMPQRKQVLREAFDRTLQTVFANWKARIRGTIDHGRSGGEAVITVEFREGYPRASSKTRRFRTTVEVPVGGNERATRSLIDRVSFEILIFKTVGRQPSGVAVSDLRDYLGRFGNVSVYDAGFRLPYYGSKRDKVGEDWLSIAADQGRRLNQSDLLPERLRTQNRYMQDLPAPGRLFGGVNIDTNHERRAASPSSRRTERVSSNPARAGPAARTTRRSISFATSCVFRLTSMQTDSGSLAWRRSRERESASLHRGRSGTRLRCLRAESARCRPPYFALSNGS